MSAAALIRQALESGVALKLVGGKVKASGSREAVARLLAPLREHRLELADALQAEPPDNPQDWRELAAAYHEHHFKCPMCMGAGRGSRYGRRCGVGQALWFDYSDAS